MAAEARRHFDNSNEDNGGLESDIRREFGGGGGGLSASGDGIGGNNFSGDTGAPPSRSRDRDDSQDQRFGGLGGDTQISAIEMAGTDIILAGIKDGKGSLGKLATDDQLYMSLNSTSNSLNTLLQDLRLHPKRYVQVSIFGKKDKTAPLMAPLPDSLSKQ